MKLKLIIVSVAAFLFGMTANGQNVGVKTNLLYDATATVNAGVEFGIAPKWTIDLSGNYNGWSKDETTQWKHWMVQPEARFWFCNRFAGHFLGIHALAQQYKFSGWDTNLKLFGTDFSLLGDHRYEGWAAGAGLAYGYAFPLAKHWNLELEAGIGYVYTQYDQYSCKHCVNRKIGDGDHHYFGPTKAAVNLVYLF